MTGWSDIFFDTGAPGLARQTQGGLVLSMAYPWGSSAPPAVPPRSCSGPGAFGFCFLTRSPGSHMTGSENAAFINSLHHPICLHFQAPTGSYRESITDFEFRKVSLPVSRLDYSLRLKCSASRTSATIYAYNFVTASWRQLNSSSIGTSEVTKNVSITSSAASYVNAEGRSLFRLKSSKLFGNHSISSDLVSLIATP